MQGYFVSITEIFDVNELRKKILIIDDMPEMVSVVVEFLQNEHYIVLTSTNGKEGVVINEQKDPDLIILDLRMPIMDGIATLKEIRKTDSRVKVIILSGYIDEKIKKDFEGLHVNDYLDKPFDGHQLFYAITNVLGS